MARKKVEKETESSYSKLEEYCIWLNEYYNALLKSGFEDSIARAMIIDKDSYPEWVSFKTPTKAQIEDFGDDA